MHSVTMATGSRAIRAEALITGIAIAEFIRGNRGAAVGAFSTKPLVQRDVGAALVVVGQHTADEDESVGNAALGQCFCQRFPGIAEAQRLVLDVGMCDAFVRGGRAWVLSNDFETLDIGVAGESVPVKFNVKRAKVDALENDAFRAHCERLGLSVDFQAFELFLDLLQFCDQRRNRWNRRLVLFCVRRNLIQGASCTLHPCQQMAIQVG